MLYKTVGTPNQILYFGFCFVLDIWHFSKEKPLAIYPCGESQLQCFCMFNRLIESMCSKYCQRVQSPLRQDALLEGHQLNPFGTTMLSYLLSTHPIIRITSSISSSDSSSHRLNASLNQQQRPSVWFDVLSQQLRGYHVLDSDSKVYGLPVRR